MLRWLKTEVLKEDLWVFVGFAHTATANFDGFGCRQNDVHESEVPPLIENAAWFVPQVSLAAPLSLRFPKDVGQKTNQDVHPYTVLFLMPDWANPFECETPLPLQSAGCTLAITPRLSNFDMTAQNVAAVGECGPSPMGLVFRP